MDNQSLPSPPHSSMETTTRESVVCESAEQFTLHTSTSSTSLRNLDTTHTLRDDEDEATVILVPIKPSIRLLPPLFHLFLHRNLEDDGISRDNGNDLHGSFVPTILSKFYGTVLTILLSVLYIYATHTSIRDRSIRTSNFGLVCDAWFLVDILLNFVTEYRSEDGVVLRQGQAVWARYLTTWFVVDALSLVPWESLYVKPIIEMQNKRRFFKKYFFRTRAVIRVTRVLRGRHFRLFGKVARRTKHAGVGANRLLRLLIKYVPKYLLFYRNMKGVLMVRMLRQVHWMRKMMRNFSGKRLKKDDATDSLTMDEGDDDYYLDDEEVRKDDSDSVVQIQMDDDLDLDLY